MKTSLAALAALSALATGGAAWGQTLFNALLDVPLERPAFAWAQAPSNGVPFVRLDKTVFASGESVFFWTGVEAINHASIPKEYWNTCRQIVTRPDGTQSIESGGWPLDGPLGCGWRGGSGLGEKAQPGRYLITFEFAGQQTAPTQLLVEDLQILKRIKAEFLFGPPQKTAKGTDVPVTLTVHNGTDQTLRFPHRDGVNGLVSVRLSRGGSDNSGGFYPSEQLLDQQEPAAPNHTVENFTWKDAQEIPTVTLKPGETYTQKLSLNAAIAEANKIWATPGSASIPSGRYTATFSTMLQTLIGEPGGEFAAVSPVHLAVAGTATCSVSP